MGITFPSTNFRHLQSHVFYHITWACMHIYLHMHILAKRNATIKRLSEQWRSKKYRKTRYKRLLTESTDEITDTTHITIAVFQWKTGVPHCNGYGNLNHGEEFSAWEVSTLQCFILETCFLQWSDIIFEAGTFVSQPL